MDNYSVLEDLWEEYLNENPDSDAKIRVQGVAASMKKFDTFFGFTFGEYLLRFTDNLSKTLQSPELCAADCHALANDTLKTLENLKSYENFSKLWDKIKTQASSLDVDEPILPRKRKRPARYDNGTPNLEFDTVEKYYQHFYIEAFDLIINSIRRRFDQPGFNTYKNLENLLLKAAKEEDYNSEFEFVTNFYGTDIDKYLLETQLVSFQSCFPKDKKANLKSFAEFINLPGKGLLFSQIKIVLKLIFVMAGSNAGSERSFSGLKRLKTYLRSSMNQDRLNHLMTLNIHKEETDSLSVIEICNEFVSKSDYRMQIFGKFSEEN